MKRPLVLWFAGAALMLWAAVSLLLGLALFASRAHGTDVYREEVSRPLQQLGEGGALDYEAGARVTGFVPKPGLTERQQQERIEFRMYLFLTDGIVRRVDKERAAQGGFAMLNAVVCGGAGVALAVQALRWRPPSIANVG